MFYQRICTALAISGQCFIAVYLYLLHTHFHLSILSSKACSHIDDSQLFNGLQILVLGLEVLCCCNPIMALVTFLGCHYIGLSESKWQIHNHNAWMPDIFFIREAFTTPLICSFIINVLVGPECVSVLIICVIDKNLRAVCKICHCYRVTSSNAHNSHENLLDCNFKR